MTPDVAAISAVVTAVTFGALEGWRRYSALSTGNAATKSLGDNLGPRVQALEKAIARLESKVGLPDGGETTGK